MSHSNSSLNEFAGCMAKYKLHHIDKVKVEEISPHFTFGAIAHEVLEKAGRLRDDCADSVVTEDDYYQVIPSEVLYPELKTYFAINNWEKYFRPIIKQCFIYEQSLVNDVIKEEKRLGNSSSDVQVFREYKMSMTPEEMKVYGIDGLDQSFVGIIDLLIVGKKNATIIDYKFSTSVKTQEDFDLNSQLPLYAFFVSKIFGIPSHNIKYGYIDIPKKMFDTPTILTNGTLSRAKSQNVSAENYKDAVYQQHGDDVYYNCEYGGYYHDIYMELQNKKAAYLSIQYFDESCAFAIQKDLFNTAKMIDYMVRNKMEFLRKYDSYSCKNCEYLKYCKPWLGVNDCE